MNFDINTLNEQQKKALFALEGAVLVTAGAGSGKTRLLTHRIAYLIAKKQVSPDRILAITFTNKAANEMKERVASMVEEGKYVWISTFHSMCVKILRKHISFLEGYSNSFSIYSDSDTDKVLKKIFEERGIDDKDFRKKVDFHISNLKCSGKDLEMYRKENSHVLNINDVLSIYVAYERQLKNNNALDFDDLLLKTQELFLRYPEVLRIYQEKFLYVLVDEFQDTNRIQYSLVRMLAALHQNIFVVGDEDQSIYSWRGAEFENIFRFSKDFPACQVFKLEENYRSTKTIIEHANRVIKFNKQRLNKTLFTSNNEGEKVVYKKCYDEQEEGNFVAQTILGLISKGAQYRDFAILCRLNALSFPFEQAFTAYNIPYRLFGGTKFFERTEIKNMVSFLRVIINPKDEVSLLRIINLPKRGIGAAAIQKVRESGLAMNWDLAASIQNIHLLGLSKSYIEKFKPFADSLNICLAQLNTLPLYEFVVEVVKQFGIRNAYNTKSEEDISRLMNLDSFLELTEKYQADFPESTLNEYLESIALMSDTDSLSDENNAVTIATIHSVKGLEFKNVFVVALEEKCFPLSRAMNNDFELEEERRLMYVALTRAEERLILSGCTTRFMYGKRENTVRSRFIAELGLGDSVSRWETENRKYESVSRQANDESHYAEKPVSSILYQTEKPVSKPTLGLQLEAMMEVEHPRYGTGVVQEIRGDEVDILFEGFGKKTLIKHLAPLSIPGEE